MFPGVSISADCLCCRWTWSCESIKEYTNVQELHANGITHVGEVRLEALDEVFGVIGSVEVMAPKDGGLGARGKLGGILRSVVGERGGVLGVVNVK